MKLQCMTPEQRKFAEDNYGLFLKFLSQFNLDDEYYTALIERYLRTAVQYCQNPRLQKFTFSTVLWKNLRSELHSYWQKLMRAPVIVAYDNCYRPPGIEDAPLDNQMLQQLQDRLTSKQNDTILLRNQGYSNREIADICGVTEQAIEKRFNRIRKVMKRSKEL